MKDQFKPGDMVRPFMDLKWKSQFSSPPTPITLVKDRPKPLVVRVKKDPTEGISEEEMAELFQGPEHVATLKWTETGIVIAATAVNAEEWLMVLFGDKYGWARAKDFETLPE